MDSPVYAAWKQTQICAIRLPNLGDLNYGLLVDPDGNVYGTTIGSVFVLSPPAAGHTAWRKKVLFDFTHGRRQGTYANGGLIMDASGNIYGTTYLGGVNPEGGTVFRLTPPAAGQTTWVHTILYSFSHTVGQRPNWGLVRDAAGNLYGTTTSGGANDFGTVFELSPPSDGSTVWTEATLMAFDNNSSGDVTGPLVLDAVGNLYGTGNAGEGHGFGVVFELSPPAAGQSSWTQTVILKLNGAGDGERPDGPLVLDNLGNVYGSAYLGGKFGTGTVFELTPPNAGSTTWQETVLASFNNKNGGGGPAGGLVRDNAGSLYGTTLFGGKTGKGVAFELSPPSLGKRTWHETVLNQFNGKMGKGASGIVPDSSGSFYGAAVQGGKFGYGAIYKLTP
jgi:uncharacterized repeat protein (TIGR03803 family)